MLLLFSLRVVLVIKQPEFRHTIYSGQLKHPELRVTISLSRTVHSLTCMARDGAGSPRQQTGSLSENESHSGEVKF